MSKAKREIESIVALIEKRLREGATPERAEKEKSYLKSDLVFLGATVPAIRKVTRKILKEHDNLESSEILAVVDHLWSTGIHELRRSAVEILEAKVNEISPDDIGRVERLIRESFTWALADNLAACVVGPLVEQHRELVEVMDRWSSDPDFWIRRSALLSHLRSLRRGEGDFDRFCSYADTMLEEREFFIRKAIGWVLREIGRKRPELVVAWLEPRLDRVAGLTLREALRHVPEADRERLMKEYKRRR